MGAAAQENLLVATAEESARSCSGQVSERPLSKSDIELMLGATGRVTQVVFFLLFVAGDRK
jgi:hypothetical protein